MIKQVKKTFFQDKRQEENENCGNAIKWVFIGGGKLQYQIRNKDKGGTGGLYLKNKKVVT